MAVASDSSAAMRTPAENVIVSPTRATESTIASWQCCLGGRNPDPPQTPPQADPSRISSRTRNIRNSA